MAASVRRPHVSLDAETGPGDKRHHDVDVRVALVDAGGYLLSPSLRADDDVRDGWLRSAQILVAGAVTTRVAARQNDVLAGFDVVGGNEMDRWRAGP